MIEEIRILTGSRGRSIPQALFEVGRRGPVELRPAFAAAQREWLLSTDFDRTLKVLKDRLADPTAPATQRPPLDAGDAVALLARYADLGVGHVSLAFPTPNADVYLRQMALFAEQVLPAFT